MIEAVLFDFGGVLTRFSPFDVFGALGEAAGVAPERVRELVFGPYDQDTDHPFHRLERGELPIGDWLDVLFPTLAAEGIELDLAALGALFQTLGINDEMVARARALRHEGLRLAIVTNNVKEGADAWQAMLPVGEIFHAVIDSSVVGMRKPNPAIFHHALEVLGVSSPGAAVLLDDAPGNVAGARAIGMHAVHVGTDTAAALAELDRILASS